MFSKLHFLAKTFRNAIRSKSHLPWAYELEWTNSAPIVSLVKRCLNHFGDITVTMSAVFILQSLNILYQYGNVDVGVWFTLWLAGMDQLFDCQIKLEAERGSLIDKLYQWSLKFKQLNRNFRVGLVQYPTSYDSSCCDRIIKHLRWSYSPGSRQRFSFSDHQSLMVLRTVSCTLEWVLSGTSLPFSPTGKDWKVPQLPHLMAAIRRYYLT